MHTFAYKNAYIHINWAKNTVTVQDMNFKLYQVRSVHAAKIFITKLNRANHASH